MIMATNNGQWHDNLAIGQQGQNYIKTILSQAGYKVIPYGVENHIEELIKQLRGAYDTKTQRRLHLMPDYVVIDPDTKKVWLIEVKNRPVVNTYHKNTDIWFNFHQVKDIMDLWEDAILVITFPVEPYCICVAVKDIDWNKQYMGSAENKNPSSIPQDKWNFHPIEKKIYDIFTKVDPMLLKKHINLIEPPKN